jgi:DNA-binding GntR family transcriptional regulator
VSRDGIPAHLQATLRASDRSPTSHADRIHLELRRALLSGELAPSARLTEVGLAERFQTSRTPVREALRRLETEGHLVRDPAGGLLPRVPRASLMREVYEVRIALEDLVVRRAAGRAPGADEPGLERLRGEWADLQATWPRLAGDFDLPQFVLADEGFHETLARLSGNTTAERHLRDVNEHIRMLRIHDFTTTDRIETTIAEHVAIADDILAGDTAAACARMRDHVQASAGVVEQRVGAVLARMFETEPADA